MGRRYEDGIQDAALHNHSMGRLQKLKRNLLLPLGHPGYLYNALTSIYPGCGVLRELNGRTSRRTGVMITLYRASIHLQ